MKKQRTRVLGEYDLDGGSFDVELSAARGGNRCRLALAAAAASRRENVSHAAAADSSSRWRGAVRRIRGLAHF